MPLKGRSGASDEAAAQKAAATFDRLEKSFGTLPSTTETLSFRVPKGEKARLRLMFARHGMTLAEGLKKATYQLAEQLETS